MERHSVDSQSYCMDSYSTLILKVQKAFTAVEPFTHAFNAYHFMNHIPEGFIHHTVKEAAAALFLYILAPREVPRL